MMDDGLETTRPRAGYSVAMKVADKLKVLGSAAVEDAAVEVMVERTLKKRTDAVVSVWDKVDAGERELRKLAQDVIGYDESGKKVSEAFSKERIDERGKVTQRIGKLRKALDKALSDNDFGDVLNIANEKAG